jgi:hypothetical protein
MAARFHLPKQKCVKRLVPKTRRGTIVGTVKRGSAFFLIACPPGKMGKSGKCKSGTKAVEVIKPASRGKCPAGYKRGGSSAGT